MAIRKPRTATSREGANHQKGITTGLGMIEASSWRNLMAARGQTGLAAVGHGWLVVASKSHS